MCTLPLSLPDPPNTQIKQRGVYYYLGSRSPGYIVLRGVLFEGFIALRGIIFALVSLSPRLKPNTPLSEYHPCLSTPPPWFPPIFLPLPAYFVYALKRNFFENFEISEPSEAFFGEILLIFAQIPVNSTVHHKNKIKFSFSTRSAEFFLQSRFFFCSQGFLLT